METIGENAIVKQVNKKKDQWKTDILQIMRKTLISRKKEKQGREDRQEESRKERSNEVVPFPRWEKLNLPRLKIQSWRFEK